MNIRQLQLALEEAIAGGLPYDTEVVIATNGWYDILEDVETPLDSECDVWFTLTPGDPADARFTPGGLPQ